MTHANGSRRPGDHRLIHPLWTRAGYIATCRCHYSQPIGLIHTPDETSPR